jgi:hypothetical protein
VETLSSPNARAREFGSPTVCQFGTRGRGNFEVQEGRERFGVGSFLLLR